MELTIMCLGLAAVGLIVICDTIVFALQKRTINDLEKEVEELRRLK